MQTFSHLEDYINNLYTSIHVINPKKLEVEMIANRLGFTIEFIPLASMHINGVIFIDSRKTTTQQWQDFGHELCHALMHFGNQVMMPMQYKDFLEWKANNFAQHACIPTFMLNAIELPCHEEKAVWMIQETFNVEYEFAEKRLRQYNMNRLRL